MERVKSGINYLDKLLKGGFPRNHVVMILGEPGVGKSILGLQYIYEGAKMGEPGIFVSLEQDKSKIIEQVKQFWPDFDSFIKKKKILVINEEPTIIPTILKNIEKGIKSIGAKRMVIDSFSTISNLMVTYKEVFRELGPLLESSSISMSPDQAIIRKAVHRLLQNFRQLNCTTLLISEARNGHSIDLISEYASDGIIVLEFSPVAGGSNRTLEIRKMRNTNFDEGIMPLDITKKGIKVMSCDKERL